MPKPRRTLDDLIARLAPNDRGCLVYTWAVRKDGYVVVYYDGRSQYLHRLLYEKFVGPIPKGCDLDHLCWNPRCVNVEHLEAVSRSVHCKRRRSFTIPETAR